VFDTNRLKNIIQDSGVSCRQNAKSWVFDCPRCDKRQKLWLRKSTGFFTCFSCNSFRGRAEYALSELLGETIDEIKTKLYGLVIDYSTKHFDLSVDQFQDEDDDLFVEESVLIPTVGWPIDCFPMDNLKAKKGLDYLVGRGIPKDIAVQYDLRYKPDEKRVYFPVKLNGRLVGWQKRLIVPDKVWSEDRGSATHLPKILSSEGNWRDSVVMFSDRINGHRHVVLCEGPIDAIKAHACGANVASMGKMVSRGQIEMLRNQGIERIYLALDPDAFKEIEVLISEFCVDLDVRVMFPPYGVKDLGEMSIDAVYKLFLNAPRVTRHFIFNCFA